MADNKYGSIHTYSKQPLTRAEYSNMRGVMDYSNAKMFNLFESGYSYLKVLSRPKWLEAFADGTDQRKMLELFCWILEYEFRGLDGIDDVQADQLAFEDGINTINTIGKVNMQSAAEISMTFTERSGLAITKFIDYYLKGCRDPRTQAKTYHGLIADGKIAGGFENEVFNLLYMVTDNTMLGLEKAYLLVNAWPSKAETSVLNSTKGEIDKKEITIPWQCFVLEGDDVDELGLKCLAYINEQNAVAGYLTSTYGNSEKVRHNTISGVGNVQSESGSPVHLDSSVGFDYQAVTENKDTFNAKSTV